MATALDTALRDVASTVLSRFGTSVTIRTVTPGTYQTATGDATDTSSDAVVKGFWEEYRATEIIGLVQQGDRKLTLAAKDLSAAPRVHKDKVVDGGKEYEIVSVEEVRSGDEAAIYVLQCRGV